MLNLGIWGAVQACLMTLHLWCPSVSIHCKGLALESLWGPQASFKSLSSIRELLGCWVSVRAAALKSPVPSLCIPATAGVGLALVPGTPQSAAMRAQMSVGQVNESVRFHS